MNHYFAFGMNHRTAPVDIRERFEMRPDRLEALYAATGLLSRTEWLVVSTCNRTEVYGHGPDEDARHIRHEMENLCGPWPEDHAFHLRHDEAIRHVVEVITGLRSQVWGDAQILSQAKQAYRVASTAGTLGPWMHRLMHTAFAAAKQIAGETAVGSSIAQAAVRMAHTELERRATPWNALVLGAGQMARLVLAELSRHPGFHVTLVNRNRERAEALASEFGADAVGQWADRHRLAGSSDLVVGATSADAHVLSATELPEADPARPVLLVDIAVPRNIDPGAADRAGYVLHNIDAIATGSGLAPALSAARSVCDEAIDGLSRWESEHAALQPAIRTLYETFESVREREVARNIHRFDPAEREYVERLTRSIMQKLLAVPVVRLKGMAAENDDLTSRIELLNSLFARPECEETST